MPSVLVFSFALASRSARSLSVLASVASNTALYSAIAAEGASGVTVRNTASARALGSALLIRAPIGGFNFPSRRNDRCKSARILTLINLDKSGTPGAAAARAGATYARRMTLPLGKAEHMVLEAWHSCPAATKHDRAWAGKHF